MFQRMYRASEAAEILGSIWCGLAHGATMWPIHGHYRCATCGRQYRVPWAEPAAAVSRQGRQATLASLGAALLPLLLLVVAAATSSPARAADEMMNSNSGPAMAFARYTAAEQEAGPWRLETIEIDASLPKLAKQGRFRAIRRLLPFGRPQYQVLEIDGDQTIKQQVIERYLSTEAHVADIPASSVAISPANYKFRYNGTVMEGSGLAYAFLITPRKKREGLIKGELWLDGQTGLAVRQSGWLVKRPSFFVKRINVTREISLSGGVIEARITHLSLDLRLVGRAEIVVKEHPVSTVDCAPATDPESCR